MVDQKFVVRAFVLYDFKKKNTAAESYRSLCDVFDGEVMSPSQVRKWFVRFRSGDESLEDDERSGRPQIVDEVALKDTVELDNSVTLQELADTFDCSHTTISTYLHAMGKTYRSGRWVPHDLTNAQLANRVTTAGILLRRAHHPRFLERIITGDEKWITFDNVVRKRHWLDRGETAPATPKTKLHGKKAMLSIWWNISGVVHWELVEEGKTVTADLYRQQLERVDQALQRRRVYKSKIKLLHDNARPHVAKITRQKLEELEWEVLPHPPYSPDIAPTDYHLFRSMQHALSGQRFKNRAEIENFVADFLASKPRSFFKDGIKALTGRWKQIIDNNGHYIVD